MVLAALCDRIGSALLGMEKQTPVVSRTAPTKTPPSAAAAGGRGTASVVQLASRGERAGRLAAASPRAMSPRQMAELGQRLRESGLLNADECRLLCCHVELHQDHAKTIGAIGGSPASPNRPRDLILEWEERLAFTQTHIPCDQERIRRIERIIDVLRSLAEDASSPMAPASRAR